MSEDSVFDVGPHCSAKCAEPVQCVVCRRTKQPRGRDSRDNGLCDYDCPGYREEPIAGHLWPGEWSAHLVAIKRADGEQT